MKLTDLTITRLPGWSEPLRVEGFDPGFTLVTGPNASGKSSLMRALGHLIAPQAMHREGPLTLEASFRSGEDLYTVTRSGEQVDWQCNGQPVDPPEMPAGDFLRCYWLSMGDLLHAGETETAIVSRLQRELAGGFDLASVQADRLFEIRPRQGQGEAKRLREREQTLTQRQREYAQLDQQRHRLTELDGQIEAARAARAGAQRTQQALHWLEVRQRREEAEARLAQFPQSMGWLQGHELERLEELEGTGAAIAADIEANRRQQEEAGRRYQQAHPGGSIPESVELEACQQHLEEADRLASDLEGVSERLEAAQVRLTNAASALNPPRERIPQLTPQEVNEAGTVAESLRRGQLRLAELEARQERIQAPAGDPDALRTQIAELRRWLRQLEPVRRRALLGGSGLAMAAAAVTAFFGWLYGLPLTWAPALLALAAAGWSAQQCVFLITTAREAQRRAEEAGVVVSAWEPDPVSDRLRELEGELAELEHQQVVAQQARPLQEEIERLRGEIDQLEGNKQAVADAVGFDPELIGESAARFLKLASDLDEARGERDRLQQRYDQLTARREQALEPVRDLLSRHALLPADTSGAGLRAAFRDLQRRTETLREVQGELERLGSQLERLQSDDQDQREAVAALYRKVGLAEGERHRLEQLVGMLEAYRSVSATLEAERLAERSQSVGIETDPDLAGRVEAGDRAGLEQRLRALEEQAGDYDRLVDERSALSNRLDQAGRDQALEQARFERDRAKDALEDAFDAAMLAEAGQFLLSEVDEAHRSEREPAVLADAREHFARFTHHRYLLRMDPSGALVVRDQVQEQKRHLGELSTGTHMQLLMALRLAWVREQERGTEALPIFLDEVLTTSDPERFRAIAASLQVLVEEGRQIVYLSADPADRTLWQQRMGNRLVHLDLQALREGTELPAADAYQLPEPGTGPLPDPGSSDPEVWARQAGVPPIRPFQGAGSIAVFHLLRDDLPLVHHLMQDWRVDRLGRLENLLQQPAADRAVPDPGVREQLRARTDIARAWVRAWQRGRGQPVDRNVLEASGAVTPKFIDAVATLAEQLDGNGQLLIEALEQGEVPRFQSTKLQELESYLQQAGYLDAEEVLDAEGRERTVLMEAGDRAEGAAIRQWVGWLEAALLQQ